MSKIIELLTAMAVAAHSAANAEEKAKAGLEKAREEKFGAYDGAIQAAALAGSWSEFEKEYNSFENMIRKNIGGLAVKVKAEKRDEISKNGDKYKIPGSVSSAKTVIKFAFLNGVSMTLDGKPRSFTDIRSENNAIRELKRQESAKEEYAKASPRDRLLHDAAEALSRLAKQIKEAPEAFTDEQLTALCDPLKYAPASTGETLEAEAAKPAKRGRARKNGSDLDTLSKGIRRAA